MAAAGQSGASEGLCAQAAEVAAASSGVPVAVLTAISMTETGRGPDSDPWPWAVNHAGEGHWFDSPEEAIAYVTAALQEGETNLDIGCFQINHRWHGAAFTSLEAMFDPVLNAQYAAGYLASHHQAGGTWSEAAGAYHSRTAEYAERYRARFDANLARLEGSDRLPGVPPLPDSQFGTDVVADVRENSFPLLRPGGVTAGLGSLVPINLGG